MSEPEIVVSTEVLAELQTSLKRYRNFILDHLRAVQSDLNKVRAGMEDRWHNASRHVSAYRDRLDSADEDDDVSALQDELREAEDELECVERAKRQLSELAAEYQKRALRLLTHAENDLPRAISMLRAKEEAGYQLRDISDDGMTGFIGAGCHMMAGIAGGLVDERVETANTLLSKASNAVDLTSNPLPSGYCWIPLTELDLEDAFQDVKSSSDFRSHASYDTMRKGLEILKETVLPAVAAQGYAADSFLFMRTDRRAGTDYEHGSQRVFDAFFGQDAIALQPSTSPGKFAVINGRHRIKAAFDAGWLAIPVKVPRKTSS